VPAQLLVSEIGIASFGLDPSNGDVLPVNYNTGRIRRLTRVLRRGGASHSGC
jgi:hypothetical protein